MYQAAVFPSLTASTVVSAIPAKSPPHQIFGWEVCMVLWFTMGRLPSANCSGAKASITKIYKKVVAFVLCCGHYFFGRLIQNQTLI